MTNDEIAKIIAKAATAFSEVTIEQWQYIDELAQGLEGQILCFIQDKMFEHYRNELIETLIAGAALKPGEQPKDINCDIYAGLLRGIRIASIRDIAKRARQHVEAAKKAEEGKAGNTSKLPSNPYV
jgi:hypothetical protein